MTSRQFFSVLYTLMAEEAGGRMALETGLEKWQAERELEALANSPDRFDPDVPLPEPAAQEMASLMGLGAPAKRRDS